MGSYAHSARAKAVSLNGRNDDDEKGVGVVDKVNEGIVNVVVDRDYEPQCWEQLACGYAASAPCHHLKLIILIIYWSVFHL